MENILKTIGGLFKKEEKKENKPIEIKVITVDMNKASDRFKQFVERVNAGR